MKKKHSSNSASPSENDSVLSDEDLEIWNRFKHNIEPLSDNARNRGSGSKPDLHYSGDAVLRTGGIQTGSSRPQNETKNIESSNNSRPDPFQLDRKSVRRIRSGRIALEARLDLHGMRQDQAYISLKKFLLRCQSDGLTTVLVITGKGKSENTEESEIWDDRSRGILRRVVPEWLVQPEFQELILGYNTASERHGGLGALYINIRRRRLK